MQRTCRENSAQSARRAHPVRLKRRQPASEDVHNPPKPSTLPTQTTLHHTKKKTKKRTPSRECARVDAGKVTPRTSTAPRRPLCTFAIISNLPQLVPALHPPPHSKMQDIRDRKHKTHRALTGTPLSPLREARDPARFTKRSIKNPEKNLREHKRVDYHWNNTSNCCGRRRTATPIAPPPLALTLPRPSRSVSRSSPRPRHASGRNRPGCRSRA